MKMIVSTKLKLIFSHIPKTGGASLKRAILDVDPGARHEVRYHNPINRGIIKKYPEYRKVTIVRNSYEAVASGYRFNLTRRLPPGVPTDKKARRSYYKRLNAKQKDRHLARMYKEVPFKVSIQRSRSGLFNQLAYVMDKDGMLVDVVLHFENLGEEVSKLDKRLKINKYRLHSLGPYDYHDLYDEETKAMVAERCKRDIEYFNWKF